MKHHYITKILILFLVLLQGDLLAQAVVHDPSVSDPTYYARKQAQVQKTVTAFSSNSIQRTATLAAISNAEDLEAPGGYFPLDDSFTVIPKNDDGSYGPVALPFSYNLYGNLYKEVYINTNGNLTFEEPNPTYSASGFPNHTPMVAPFWADVDTREGGDIYFKVTTNALIVIYDQVAHYGPSGKVNTFQVIITDGNSDLVEPGMNTAFCSMDMQWTTGGASSGVNGLGGIPATVGINKGNGIDYLQVGRFDSAGSSYDGPVGENDGIDYLDNQCFNFNMAFADNIPPSASNLPAANKVELFFGETLNFTPSFIGPEPNQTVTTTVSSEMCGMTYEVTNGSLSEASITIVGQSCNVGTHTITLTSVDDGSPQETLTTTISVEVKVKSSDITITSSASSVSGWDISGGVLTATDSVFINHQVIEDALEAGDLVVSSTRDIFIDADIAPALAGNSTFTLKAVRDIHMETNSSITATGFALNTILWGDADATDGGMVFLKTQAEILTQGGHLWIGGGDGSTTWNGLTVGDGTAIGNINNSNGITFINTNIESGGGNIAFYGRGLTGATKGVPITISTGAETNTNGIRLHDGNFIDAGSGSIYMYGFADNSYATSNSNGIELSHSAGGDMITSSNSTADAIFMEGYAEGPASVQNSWGFYTHLATVQNTGGGTIHIKGSAVKNSGVTVAGNGAILANGGKIILEGTAAGGTIPSVLIQGAVGQKAGTAITSSEADIEIIGDRFSASAGRLQSSGVLAIRPYTAGTEIGVGSATGTLRLPASYFQTNFMDGFSKIIIGDENAGHIMVGGSMVYQDPLTLKTDGNILFSNDAEVQSVAANALTLWARASGDNEANDLNHGTIWMPQGSSIHTGGGNLTLGGGSDPYTGYALGNPSATSAENNAIFRGVAMNGAVNAAGGNIVINGKGALASNVSHARGVNIGGPVETTGAGNITVSGIGIGSSDAIALGDTYFSPDAIGTLETGTGDITLDGKPSSSTRNGLNVSTSGSYIKTDGNFSATTTGRITATVGALDIGGNTTLEAEDNITLTHTNNDFGGPITVIGAANLQITDKNELTLGGISISGTMGIASFDGDLTISGNISTTNATAAAIRIFADKTKAAGDPSGGNIKIVGTPVFSTGTGGQARFYSGSLVESADLISLTGKGNTRYEVDASTTVFNPSLGSGIYALIRGKQRTGMISNSMIQQRLR